MRFKDVFSIIGPAMVGPSSSHTAGAARIGRVARLLFGDCPARADILLYGSFAATYRGHGTDTALVGGLLDMTTDDPRLPEALAYAENAGMAVSIAPGKGLYPHPNTAELYLSDAAGNRKLQLTGTSIGGGNVEIVKINGFSMKLSAAYPTLTIRHRDETGIIAIVTGLLGGEGINIAHMTVDRRSRRGEAMMVLECDGIPAEDVLQAISALPAVEELRLLAI
ncbi:L-serine ammonia-lyase, iron-sulfur-dependent subunit beta [Paenibacillus sp. NFR01]|uniref:L-serine ammonia-lyase, iron-sulfur-dependent subunit beta n=1 Tax=Paenibacillus sp. NFR01 TaxID=1566279 RepID=UPI0008BAB68A|nr:L-serine ammonia-lyase, iron-sulfur-dependent subunit beta [Paenibacillus sp. NFR01]SEU28205.1 L-serine dehydratase [Paenibacillus sp. NFR01]